MAGDFCQEFPEPPVFPFLLNRPPRLEAASASNLGGGPGPPPGFPTAASFAADSNRGPPIQVLPQVDPEQGILLKLQS
jgi:hypothetical protein